MAVTIQSNKIVSNEVNPVEVVTDLKEIQTNTFLTGKPE